IFEACLYMRRAVDEHLWHQVYAALGELSRDPQGHREVALAVDALTWRPPPEPYRNPPWPRDFVRSSKPSEARWALLRFLAGYHGAGLHELDVEELLRQDLTVSWTEEQAEFAAWLVRWHFIHQSRARAQFARQPWVDKDFLCRALHPTPTKQDQGPVNRLL